MSGTRFVNGEAVKAVDGDGMADLVSIRCSLLSPTTIHCNPIDEKVETNINEQHKQFWSFQGGGGH